MFNKILTKEFKEAKSKKYIILLNKTQREND